MSDTFPQLKKPRMEDEQALGMQRRHIASTHLLLLLSVDVAEPEEHSYDYDLVIVGGGSGGAHLA